MLLSANIQQIIVYVILAVVAVVMCSKIVSAFIRKGDKMSGCGCCSGKICGGDKVCDCSCCSGKNRPVRKKQLKQPKKTTKTVVGFNK